MYSKEELLNILIDNLRNIFKNIEINLYDINEDLLTISYKIKYSNEWEFCKISISEKIKYDKTLLKQLILECKENIKFYIYDYFIKEGE